MPKSIGMNADTVKRGLVEVNRLQARVQELELAVQDKASMNHASKQPVFGTANAQMHGNVKFGHDNT